MALLAEQKLQVEEILTVLCEQLELTDTQRQDAEQKYGSVAKWLSKPGTSLYDYGPDIYPQGSFLLRTTVRPLGQDEFDVDLVCQLNISESTQQSIVMKMVGDRIKENDDYRRIIVPMNRCWRLNYAGEFHMDILPAIPDSKRGLANVLVPDKELNEWKESNPIGFGEWFDERTKSARAMIYKSLVEASVQDLPDNDTSIKTPLHRIVQLLKRHRDIAFSGKKDAPISIVISTLAAKAYRGGVNLYDAIFNVIDGMPREINFENNIPKVKNPINEKENFAESWEKDTSLYKGFCKWLIDLRQSLASIPVSSGMPAIKKSLTPLFGERILEQAFKKYAERIEEKRRSGNLYVGPKTGMLGAAGIKMARNTFYGK